MGTPPLWGQAEKVGMSSLEKGKLWGDLTVPCQSLKGYKNKWRGTVPQEWE